ncbi:WD40-repeat-containing domain protein [Rhodotorula diobovata]|uniref:WD40-repeat-containing domain protein n=1 Tax=Rhodotorula diobovata TaxID=5288 RepID=A0A5C5FMH4_9BASI|nr:WD40-repeat-containing domain protein [Rhodotorula diobovata]
MDHVVPPGHLVRLLQKGLLYLEAEARYRGDPLNPPPRLVGYPIPPSLPLPPLPKYVPPPAPAAAPAAPTPTPTPTPDPMPPVSAAAEDAKGKGKGKGKAKEPAAVPAPAPADRDKDKRDKAGEEGAGAGSAPTAKRARTTSDEAPAAGTGVGAAALAGKKGKGKEREMGAAGDGAGKGRDKEKEREREREKAKDAEGDVSMDDAHPPPPAAAARERDKDDLRPPPAKKAAAAAAAASSSSLSSAAAAPPTSASASAATPTAKRSASPTVSRKPAHPTSTSASSSTSASAAAAPATPAPAAAPAPTPQGNKFRITTTTKTVTTPVPPSAGALAAAQQQQQQQRRRGSGDAGAGAGAEGAAGTGAAGTGRAGLGKNGAAGGKSPIKAEAGWDLKGVKVLKCEDKEVIKLKGHTQMKVQPCAFNAKVPSLLATGGADGTCRIWDVPSSAPSPPLITERMKCRHPSSSRRVDITAVAWDPSGSLLATATEDGIARIWTVSGDLHLVLSMHQRSISALKWSPGGTMLLTASLDQTVCLWEVSNGKVRQQYSTHSDQVLDVDWNDDGLFASTSSDRMVHLLSTSRPTPLHRFRGHRDDVNVVKFSPCGTLVASCADDTTVRVWSLRGIAPIARDIAAKPCRRGDAARRIDAVPEGGGQGEGGGAGRGGVGGGVWVLEGHESDVHQVAWHPTAGKEGSDGPRLLASCSFDSTAKLWDADAGTCLHTFARATDFVYSISFEPTLGRYLATGSNDGRLDVWRVKDHALVQEYTHSGEIYELTWHPHGRQLAVCGGTEEVAVVPVLLPPGA